MEAIRRHARQTRTAKPNIEALIGVINHELKIVLAAALICAVLLVALYLTLIR
jgi:hypothetical protein